MSAAKEGRLGKKRGATYLFGLSHDALRSGLLEPVKLFYYIEIELDRLMQ